VGSRKIREILLKQLSQKPENEIAQLFYRTFIEPSKPDNMMELMEYPVAIGKAKPTLTTLIKHNGQLQFENINWTLRWKYFDKKSREEKDGRPLLNSRCENVFWQHEELIYSKRCIIPVDGYWEFYHFNGKTFPFFIYPKHGGLFYLGGIWNEYFDKSTGELTKSFSIITTPPNEVTAKLHNNPKAYDGARMLLILDEQDANKYLDDSLSKNDIEKSFFTPYDASKIKFHSTVRFLKKEFKSYLASAKVQDPFDYPELVA